MPGRPHSCRDERRQSRTSAVDRLRAVTHAWRAEAFMRRLFSLIILLALTDAPPRCRADDRRRAPASARASRHDRELAGQRGQRPVGRAASIPARTRHLEHHGRRRAPRHCGAAVLEAPAGLDEAARDDRQGGGHRRRHPLVRHRSDRTAEDRRGARARRGAGTTSRIRWASSASCGRRCATTRRRRRTGCDPGG